MIQNNYFKGNFMSLKLRKLLLTRRFKSLVILVKSSKYICINDHLKQILFK